jgi:RimJ/RimL family protein N-acetyltransferase
VARSLVTISLVGVHVTLTPLEADDVPELARAASIDRSSYGFTVVPEGVDAMRRYVDDLLAARSRGEVLPFVQRRTEDGRPIGCTRLMEPRWWSGRPEPDEIEIGGTWLAADAQRTGVNTEAKLMLLAHAFDVLGVWRVAICTDADNARSRTAIERIGATFEGVLRSHRPRAYAASPIARDTAVYAVTRQDWPVVRDGLRHRLDGR